jgi:hypothetical protein
MQLHPKIDPRHERGLSARSLDVGRDRTGADSASLDPDPSPALDLDRHSGIRLGWAARLHQIERSFHERLVAPQVRRKGAVQVRRQGLGQRMADFDSGADNAQDLARRRSVARVRSAHQRAQAPERIGTCRADLRLRSPCFSFLLCYRLDATALLRSGPSAQLLHCVRSFLPCAEALEGRIK